MGRKPKKILPDSIGRKPSAGAVGTLGNKMGRRFRPGESGNPAGSANRPSVKAIREKLSEVDPVTGKSNFDRILERTVRMALQGSKWHAQYLLDQALGKPMQQNVNVNTELSAERFADLSDEELMARVEALRAEVVGAEHVGIPAPPVRPDVPLAAHERPSPAPALPAAPPAPVLTPREAANLESERIQREAEQILRTDFITGLCGRGSTKPS
jgi:hypothetical protein